MTDQVRAALAAIDPTHRHVERMRYTVRRVAWSIEVERAGEEVVFTREPRDPQLCSRTIWYGKWRKRPDVQAALTACREALRGWRDAEVERAETEALRRVRLMLSEKAPEAIIDGLMGIINDGTARGDHRLAAVDRLTQLAVPELAARIPVNQASAVAVEVRNLDDFIERELARVAGSGENGAAETATGDADAL